MDDTELRRAYLQHYYPSSDADASPNYENTPRSIILQTFQQFSEKYGSLRGKNLLDFGCGVGGLCRIAKQCGANVIGIEPDANARQTASNGETLRVYRDLSQLSAAEPNLKFDIVTMWDVIEHLREPWRDLIELSKVLRADGWLLLSTPNARSLRAVVEGKRWENYSNPTHFYYFTRYTLKTVLKHAGFVDVSELWFPIRYPHRTIGRRFFNWALALSRLQGQLLFVARLQPVGLLTNSDGVEVMSDTEAVEPTEPEMARGNLGSIQRSVHYQQWGRLAATSEINKLRIQMGV